MPEEMCESHPPGAVGNIGTSCDRWVILAASARRCPGWQGLEARHLESVWALEARRISAPRQPKCRA